MNSLTIHPSEVGAEQQKLFDRIINLELIGRDGSVTKLTCPESGMKPSITISGRLTGGIISSFTIRIVNFYTSIPLDNDSKGGSRYSKIRVVAGYANRIYASLFGEVYVAYQAKPGPDSEVVIECVIGTYEAWTTTKYIQTWDPGTPINAICRDIAATLSTSLVTVKLQSVLSDNECIKTKACFNSNLADGVYQFAEAYGLCIMPEGDRLNVIRSGMSSSGSGIVHKIDFASSVKKTAAGLSIIAPWIPDIRPFDTVDIDAQYFSSDYSGTFAPHRVRYLVIAIDFAFSTNGSENSMTLTTTNLKAV